MHVITAYIHCTAHSVTSMCSKIDVHPSLLNILKENEDFETVFTQLFPARIVWHNIGLNLKLDVDTLSAIKVKCRDDTSEALKEMLESWFKTDPSPTWEKLCNSLCSPIVARNVLVEKIRQFVKEQGN